MDRATSSVQSPRSDACAISRAAAVLEVVGVLLTAIYLGRLAREALGVASWKGRQAEMLGGATVDFWELARLATVEQILKYGFVFLLFYFVGRWHRDRRLPAYGLQVGKLGLRQLIAIGVVAWAALGLLPHALQLAAERFPALGEGPDQWNLFPERWSLGFLAYMAAASFLLVPIVEELFARGYMVRRLAEDYGEGGGLVISATFFTLAHTQYFKAEALSLGMLASLVIGSLGFGYVFLRTGSLVPVVVAHALVNIPVPPVARSREAMLAVMVLVVVLARRPLVDWLRDGAHRLGTIAWRRTAAGTLLLTVCLALVPAAGDRLAPLALSLLLASLAAHLYERRRAAISAART